MISNKIKKTASKKGVKATAAMVSLVILSGGALALTTVSAAQAATVTYVNNVLAPEDRSYSSGSRPSVSAGSGSLEQFSADGANAEMRVTTYYPYPGYRVVSQGYSSNGTVYMTHEPAANASQQCMWSFPFGSPSIGSLRMTCSVIG